MISYEEYKSFHEKKSYHICKKEFSTDENDEKYLKVRDHCYFTGKYRGAAHNICNLRYKQHTKKVLAAFHNSSKYDFHLIIKELAEEFKGKMECLEEITEKYMTFQYQLKKNSIIDSFRFMSRL